MHEQSREAEERMMNELVDDYDNIVTSDSEVISVSPTMVTLEKMGATKQLTATNTSNKAVTWSSSNTSVATVSSTGVVTATGHGTATITVTTEDGNKTATCTVTVRIPVTGVSVSPTTVTLEKMGATQQLTVTVVPTNATNKAVTWSSSNTSVATVSSTGVVTAMGHGTATITVTTADGNKTATCAVTVQLWTLANSATVGQGKLVYPASTTNPTILKITDSATQGVSSRIRYNRNMAVGDKVEISYSCTRSNNQYYLDFYVGPKSNRVENTTGTATLTYTFINTASYLDIFLHRSDCPSAGYYATINIYSVKLNGVKIL